MIKTFHTTNLDNPTDNARECVLNETQGGYVEESTISTIFIDSTVRTASTNLDNATDNARECVLNKTQGGYVEDGVL